jgi:hypothetical protein
MKEISKLENYLQNRFMKIEQLAAACDASVPEIESLISEKLIPNPTYVVSDQGKIRSNLFGELEAEGATPGRYFHPATVVWICIANEILLEYKGQDARNEMKHRFTERFCAALSLLNETCWRVEDCFSDSGAPLAAGLEARAESTWIHFLQGTWGMCVANPVSEEAIAEKAVLKQKLIALSDNGAREVFSEAEAHILREVIDSYEAVSMPFSPAEYELTSRKTLVDDLRLRLESVK